MPSVSGIDFYKSLKQEIMVIFTTAHSTFAVESYSLSAVDYLLKPFTVERFFQAINKATEYYHFQHQRENPKTFFFIRADYSLIKINFSDILYIEGLSDYIKIYLPDQKPVVARMTMKSILEKLPAHEFMRVHRSFIIPVSRIERIQNKTILVAGVEISIGISYEETFFKHFKS
jgi:DNA-binding LytR/AlgR family response regulator